MCDLMNGSVNLFAQHSSTSMITNSNKQIELFLSSDFASSGQYEVECQILFIV